MPGLLDSDLLWFRQRKGRHWAVDRHIYAVDGTPLGLAYCQGGLLARGRAMDSHIANRSFRARYTVQDAANELVLDLRRDFPHRMNRVRIADGRDRVVGWLLQKEKFGRWTFKITDPQSQVLGTFTETGGLHQNWSVDDRTGLHLADVTVVRDPTAPFLGPSAAWYRLDFVGPTTPDGRLLVLGTATSAIVRIFG